MKLIASQAGTGAAKMGAPHNDFDRRNEQDAALISTGFRDNWLKAHAVLQRIKMSWIALWFVLILFSIALLALLDLSSSKAIATEK